MRHDVKRFWSRVKKTKTCWIWTGSRQRAGYGQFHFLGRTRAAHRVAWELKKGKIPPGLYVLHRCDNPSCVNPAHLFLGTQGDNVRDSMAKGRWAHGKSRTSKPRSFASMNRLMRLRLARPLRLRELAKETNLSVPYLSCIERGLVMPSPYAVKRIATALGQEFESLYLLIQKTYETENARRHQNDARS